MGRSSSRMSGDSGTLAIHAMAPDLKQKLKERLDSAQSELQTWVNLNIPLKRGHQLQVRIIVERVNCPIRPDSAEIVNRGRNKYRELNSLDLEILAAISWPGDLDNLVREIIQKGSAAVTTRSHYKLQKWFLGFTRKKGIPYRMLFDLNETGSRNRPKYFKIYAFEPTTKL